MSTKVDIDTYRGEELIIPLGGEVSVFVWPLRVVGTQGVGGPTFGVDVGKEEVLRFDCHGDPGHWHAGVEGKRGGYDLLGAGPTSRPFPEWMRQIPDQVRWSSQKIGVDGPELLSQAGYDQAAQALDPNLLVSVHREITRHLQAQNAEALRQQAVAEGLISA